MSTFLEQFYEIPVDENSFYLKRLFQDYAQRFINLKSVREINEENFELIKSKDSKFNYKYYLYTFKTERFILSVSKGNDTETVVVSFLETDKNAYRTDVDKLSEVYGYFEKSRFDVKYFWPTYRRIDKSFVVLKYNDEERIFLTHTSEFDPNKRDTIDAAKIEYSYDFVKSSLLNYHNQKHSLHQKPAEIYYSKNKSLILKKVWYQRDKLHRLHKPAEMVYDFKNRLKKEAYYHNDDKHRNDGPAEIYYKYEEGVLVNVWYTNDEFVKTETQKLTYLFNDLP